MNEKTWVKEDFSSFTAKIDSKGRILVPFFVRKKLGLGKDFKIGIKIYKQSKV